MSTCDSTSWTCENWQTTQVIQMFWWNPIKSITWMRYLPLKTHAASAADQAITSEKPCCLYLNHSHCICYMHIIYIYILYMQISNKYRWIPLDSSTCPHLSQVIGGSWQILRKSLHNQRVGLWNAPHMRADSSRLKYGTSSSSWRLSSWTVRFCLLQKHKESEF